VTSPVTERVTAAKHANGIDYWVITHEETSNIYHSFLVDAGGVNLAPVTTVIDTILGSVGYLKTSPDGSKMAVVSAFENLAVVFDFDNATGIMSNPIRFNITTPYGVEFSPDNSKLYVATSLSFHVIYQWDLNAGTPVDIIASQFVVSSQVNQYGALQLGPDGKMYCSRVGTSYLAVINDPNALGAACNYVHDGFFLGAFGQSAHVGLPNFATTSFNNIGTDLTPSATPQHQFHLYPNPTADLVNIPYRGTGLMTV
ncbi:MAG: lactonase family protein, partial [Planctomycetes bacterium]|nr:lactonase family protein [Planctomycetota bacterium]